MNKIYINLIIISLVPVLMQAQTNKMRGTYIYSTEEEYIQLDNDSFKIIRTQAYPTCVDLDDGDSIASYGTVEYIQDGFIKLKSVKDSNIYKNTTFEEFYDTTATIVDSIKIKFVFPFKGKYRIDASLGSYSLMSTENNFLTIPREKSTLGLLNFDIYNLSLKYNGSNGECFGRVAFYDFPFYDFKNVNANYLLITIPNLTNSYYARYIIDGEYAKAEEDKIIWRNRQYKKISNDLITPKIEIGERAIDDKNGVDIIDKMKLKYPIKK